MYNKEKAVSLVLNYERHVLWKSWEMYLGSWKFIILLLSYFLGIAGYGRQGEPEEIKDIWWKETDYAELVD